MSLAEHRRLGLCWGIVLTWAATIAPAADRKQGEHPLAGRSGSLEALLDQEDWPAEMMPDAVPGDGVGGESTRPRPVMVPGLVPLEQRAGEHVAGNPSVAELQRLIDQRTLIVGPEQGGLIETIKRWVVETDNLRQANANLSEAARAVAKQTQALTQAHAMGEAGRGLQEDARAKLAAAQGHLRQANQLVQQRRTVWEPLNAKVQPRLAPWFACYREMRKFIKHDRRDPDRRAARRVLEQACGQRGDFYEGHVLTAIAAVFDGDPQTAQSHLQKAHDGFAACRLFESGLANDYCYANLLLGRPEEVKNWAAWVADLDSDRRTTMRCWIVALFHGRMAKWNEAKTWFTKAAAKESLFGKNPKSVPEPLVGDMALFLLTAANDKVRDPQKAELLLDLLTAEASAWQVLRAQAARAADHGQWAEAEGLANECLQRCPPTMEAEIAAQRDSYRKQQSWRQGNRD